MPAKRPSEQPMLVGAVLTHLALVVATLIAIYPVLIVLKIAFNAGSGASASPWPWPERFTTAHFAALLHDRTADGTWLFGRQVLNSIVVSALTAGLGVALACTAGYAFSRFRFPGRRGGLATFMVSQMFPGVLTLVPIYILMERLGLLDRLAGLVLVYSTTAIPFCVWMLKGAFDTIPRELEESAVLDGARQWTIFWRILLPLAAPSVAVTALFSFMTAWNEFVLAFVFMSRPEHFTLPVRIQRYVGEHDIQWGLFAASSLVAAVPVMALFYALQRHIVGGLTSGAVKG